MATVFHKKGSPYWYAAFYDGAGKRVYRSTRETRRAGAVVAASKMEAAARRMNGETNEDTRAVLAVLQEAGERAVRGTLTENAARELLNRMLEYTTGRTIENPSLDEWLKTWIADKKLSNSDRTAARYEGIVNAFLDFLPKKKRISPLNSLQSSDIRDYRKHLRDGGRTAATANLAVKTLRIPLNLACRQGLIQNNPADAVGLEAAETAEKGTFTLKQVQRLLKYAEGDWEGLILAGYYTGGRIGDLSNLDWKAVDLKVGVITFRQGKTKRQVVIPVHEDLAVWFRGIPAARRRGSVFPTLAGRTAGGNNGLSGKFRRLMAEAGIVPKVTKREGEMGKGRSSLSFHSLRHSFNSAMANAGVPQEVRQKLTGHASKAVNDRYTHTELQTLAAAVDKVPSVSR